MSDIGWGIIGVPNGFQHISEGITAKSAVSVVDKRICKEEFLEPLFAVIYDTAIVEGSNNRQLMTYFVQYNFAREVEKDRPGSFYGSYVVLAGVVPADTNCYKVIMSLLKNLSDYNRGFFVNDNNRFKKDYFDDRENYDLNSNNFKEAVDLISEHTVRIKSITQKHENRKDVIVFSDDVTNVFLNSMELYGTYSTIYTVDSKAYCEYIKSKERIDCKEVTDLEEETLNIKEARKIERDRIEREIQEKKETEIKEKDRIKREAEEKIRASEEEIKSIFSDLEKTFTYIFAKNLGLNDFIEEYRNKSRDDFEKLEVISIRLKEYVVISNNITKRIQDKDLELVSEIKRLKGISCQPSSELKLAADAAYTQPSQNLKPAVNPISSSKTSESSQQKTGNSSIINKYIWFAVICIVILLSGFGVKKMFFDKDSGTVKTKYNNKSFEDSNTVQKPNYNEVSDFEYREDELDFMPENSQNKTGLISDSLSHCDYSDNLFQNYTLVEKDIMNSDNSGSLYMDIDIVSNVAESILSNEGNNTISEKDKGRFIEMLMDCNDVLNYKKYDSNSEGSNQLLPIQSDDKVRYIKVSSLK